jgi:TonB family protein
MQDAIQASDPAHSVFEQLSDHCRSELADVVRRALTMTRGAGAAVALVDGSELITCASSGDCVPSVGTRARIAGFTGLCIRAGEPLACDDTQADSRVDAAACKALNVNSIVVVPLKRRQVVMGVLAVFFGPPRAFTRSHVAMLRTLADVVATLLERDGAPPQDSQSLPAPPPDAVAMPAEPEKFPAPAVIGATSSPRLHEDKKPQVVELRPAPLSAPKPPPALARSLSAREPQAGAGLPAAEPLAVPLAQDLAAPKPRPNLVPVRAAEPPAKPVQRNPRQSDIPSFASAGLHANASGACRRVLLPLAAAAVLVFVTAGFLLYRGGTAKAASPRAVAAAVTPSSPSTPEAALSTSVSQKMVPTEFAPVKPAPPKIESPRPAGPVAAAVPREPARFVPGGSSPAASEPAPSVEAPVLDVASTGGFEVLPAPRLSPPTIAPRAPGRPDSPARVLQAPPPGYPSLALARRIEGQVVLRVKLSKQGSVLQVEPLRGNPLLQDAAAKAAKAWHYAPAYRDGNPVDSELDLAISFKLPGGM